MKISSIRALEILDSRGNPTLSVEVGLEGGVRGEAKCSLGRDHTGMHEAFELRDGNPQRYSGKGVQSAVTNVERRIAPALMGMSAADQASIDRRLIDLDRTPDKSRLGANAIRRGLPALWPARWPQPKAYRSGAGCKVNAWLLCRCLWSISYPEACTLGRISNFRISSRRRTGFEPIRRRSKPPWPSTAPRGKFSKRKGICSQAWPMRAAGGRTCRLMRLRCGSLPVQSKWRVLSQASRSQLPLTPRRRTFTPTAKYGLASENQSR